jgi:hypothetical protein
VSQRAEPHRVRVIQFRGELTGVSEPILHCARRFRTKSRNSKENAIMMSALKLSIALPKICLLQRRHVMRALIISMTAVAAVSIAGSAFAQQRSVRDMMNDLRARHGQTFEQCQALATSRGYRIGDNEIEARAVMMFIEGCIMGQQR